MDLTKCSNYKHSNRTGKETEYSSEDTEDEGERKEGGIVGNIEEGIDKEGIVEDCDLETFYAKLEYIIDAEEYLRVVCDDGPSFTETRIPHELLEHAGWIKVRR